MSDWLDEDHFTISQLIKPMVNLYRIAAGPAPVAFVRQKRMAIKEDIRFFADENEAHELWRIKARSVMEFGGRYDVVTPEGERIGVLGQGLRQVAASARPGRSWTRTSSSWRLRRSVRSRSRSSAA